MRVIQRARHRTRTQSFFQSEGLAARMKVLEWIRASQAILFEASIFPAIVGTAVAIQAGSRYDQLWFALILISLVGIQAGANLSKGYYEGRNRSAPPASPGSWFAVDSSAATNLTADPRDVLRLARIGFGLGTGAGPLLVVVTNNPVLLGFGVAGGLLAWGYSPPPPPLSHRGGGGKSAVPAVRAGLAGRA